MERKSAWPVGRFQFQRPATADGTKIEVVPAALLVLADIQMLLPERGTKELAAIIHRGLAREPKKRFADVGEVRQALVKFCR